MTVRTEQFVAIAQRGQEATAQAIRSWADVAKDYAGHVTAENPLPRPTDVHAVVDTFYTLAGRLLSEQHALVGVLVDAGTDAAAAAAEQARTVGVTG